MLSSKTRIAIDHNMVRKPKITVLLTPAFPTLAENSRVASGARYEGDELPEQRWEWPQGWMTRRLKELREQGRANHET